MNKPNMVLGLLLGVAGNALAACNANQFLDAASASAALSSNTVCYPRNCSGIACTNQEFHQAGGNLIDWKKGANDPVDPTAQVGTWSVNSAGAVTYSYGGTYFIVRPGSSANATFCTGPNASGLDVSIKSGQQAC